MTLFLLSQFNCSYLDFMRLRFKSLILSLSPSYFLNSVDLVGVTTINVSALRHLNLFRYFNIGSDDHSTDLIFATRLSCNWPRLSS